MMARLFVQVIKADECALQMNTQTQVVRHCACSVRCRDRLCLRVSSTNRATSTFTGGAAPRQVALDIGQSRLRIPCAPHTQLPSGVLDLTVLLRMGRVALGFGK
jgi:hypothetical protein